jgi:riboflavin kinase/FMN adenylyltransferase
MRIHHSFRAAKLNTPSVCTIGTFDGVHRGHQALISELVNDAQHRHMQSVVITFYPHPRPMLKGLKSQYLTLPEEKAALIAALGVDHLVVLPFTRQTMNTTASDFVAWMVERCNLARLYVGYDFAFGKGRGGDTLFLRSEGRRLGFEVKVIEASTLDRETISSTRIRKALERGDIRDVNDCLGRQFSVYAVRASNRTFYVHEDRAMPAAGEYRVRVQGEDNTATISDAAPHQIQLRTPLELDDTGEVVVRFLE